MAVVVEVADEGDVAAGVVEAPADLGDRGGRLGEVDGDADELGAGLGELEALLRVAATSAVSVDVIDWTTTGAPPPTVTFPTFTATVSWRLPLVVTLDLPRGPPRTRGRR